VIEERLEVKTVLQEFIKIASFNIQIFGQSKINKPEVMETIARIIQEFDVVAIQEVKSVEQNVIPTLLALINDEDTQYDFIISERLGRSSSKAQHVVVFNTASVICDKTNHFTFDDVNDVFEREPHGVYCESGNFDFLIVNNHINLYDVDNELVHLNTVINDLFDLSPEKDIIVVGDMNADGRWFDEDELSTIIPLWVQLIDNEVNTYVDASNLTLSRMMLRETTSDVEYTGESDVFRWDVEYGITDHDFIKKVSDHYPVYAKFITNFPDDD